MGRPLLYPDEVGKLQRPYSLVMSDSDPAIMYAPDLSQYAMNEFLGMGDEEHNNRLRQKKQKSIRKMNVPIIQKWNYGEFGMCGKDTLMHKY